jgi:Holliday junction resolvase RusA-like endonuclease
MENEFEITFDTRPVPFRASGADHFKQQVQSKLRETTRIFATECSVYIELYLEEHTHWNTDEYGDIDNYAKSILDALKGYNGIILDDYLISHLSVSRMEFVRGNKFNVRIVPLLGDISMHKPITLYEMPDRLYYPLPHNWLLNSGEMQELPYATQGALDILHEMTSRANRNRHRLRQQGTAKEEAFQEVIPYLPILKGLPKSRVIDSGFPIKPLNEWKL